MEYHASSELRKLYSEDQLQAVGLGTTTAGPTGPKDYGTFIPYEGDNCQRCGEEITDTDEMGEFVLPKGYAPDVAPTDVVVLHAQCGLDIALPLA